VCDTLGIEIEDAAFAHRLYQFALAHSGWRHAVVVTGGESFVALYTGLQSALWALGGVPEEHCTPEGYWISLLADAFRAAPPEFRRCCSAKRAGGRRPTLPWGRTSL
jgi:hypothetical protein